MSRRTRLFILLVSIISLGYYFNSSLPTHAFRQQSILSRPQWNSITKPAPPPAQDAEATDAIPNSRLNDVEYAGLAYPDSDTVQDSKTVSTTDKEDDFTTTEKTESDNILRVSQEPAIESNSGEAAKELEIESQLVVSEDNHSSSTESAEVDLIVPDPIKPTGKKSLKFPNATIGMVTMMYGESNPVYERALMTHYDHAERHGYRVKVLRQKLLGRLWSKPAYLLSIVLDELQKPKEKRLKWLFWFDADTVIVNPKIPLEVFLPPSPEFDHIHFLCGDDHHGLNDGAFLMRVNDYSLHLLAATLTVESFRPEVNLRFSEQSAMEHVVQSEDIVRPWESFSYTDGYAKIPQRWMNAYTGNRDERGRMKKGKKQTVNGIHKGDLLLHFAGSGEKKRSRMTTFMDVLEQEKVKWERDLGETKYETEIAAFWNEWRLHEEKRHHDLELIIAQLEQADAENRTLSETTANGSQEQIGESAGEQTIGSTENHLPTDKEHSEAEFDVSSPYKSETQEPPIRDIGTEEHGQETTIQSQPAASAAMEDGSTNAAENELPTAAIQADDGSTDTESSSSSTAQTEDTDSTPSNDATDDSAVAAVKIRKRNPGKIEMRAGKIKHAKLIKKKRKGKSKKKKGSHRRHKTTTGSRLAL